MEDLLNAVSSNSSISAALKAQKRIFFSKIAKWFYNNCNTDEDLNLDVTDMIVLLQALGFKLRKFEKNNFVSSSNDLKIEIKCGISNFEAVLVYPCSNCKCPTPKTMAQNGGEFWEVTGFGPKNQKGSNNLFTETGSSLVPSISKEKQFVVRDILLLIFQTIHSPHEHGETEISEADKRNLHREASFDVHPSKSIVPTIDVMNESGSLQMPPPASASTPTRLIREKTWEVVPSIAPSSPPIPPVLSSPVPDLCLSVGQMSVSMNTENHLSNLLQEIHQRVAKALELVPHHQPTNQIKPKTAKKLQQTPMSLSNIPKQMRQSMTLPRPRIPPTSSITMRSSDSIQTSSRKRNMTAIPKSSSSSMPPRPNSLSTTKRDRPNTAPFKPDRQTLSARRRVSFDSKTPRPTLVFKNS